MDRLTVNNFGMIKKADVTFGDLTIFTGPQASGKSVFLQLYKFLCDKDYIASELGRVPLFWENNLPIGMFFNFYFGWGMESLWRNARARIAIDGNDFRLSIPDRSVDNGSREKVFYIPAQRIMALRNGWPIGFRDFSVLDPFIIRNFSETLRRLLEESFMKRETLFPMERRLKKEFKEHLDRNIFYGFQLKTMADSGPMNSARLVLQDPDNDETPPLPFMSWSAGQREFMPLLLGLYWLLPGQRINKRDEVETVVIEEPEMGLHPNAIVTVLLLVIDLLKRGYRVCISTHSPQVLDIVWALGMMKRYQADAKHFMNLFGLAKNNTTRSLAEEAMKKEYRVYYFDPDDGNVKNISGLDPSSFDETEAGWGGLTRFSGHVGHIVADVVSEAERGAACRHPKP